MEVEQSLCTDYVLEAPPVTEQACATSRCAPSVRWQAGEWGPCSADCGGGTRSRTCTCVTLADGSEANETLCEDWPKPPDTTECNTAACDFCKGGLETCSSSGTCDYNAQVRPLEYSRDGPMGRSRWANIPGMVQWRARVRPLPGWSPHPHYNPPPDNRNP